MLAQQSTICLAAAPKDFSKEKEWIKQQFKLDVIEAEGVFHQTVKDVRSRIDTANSEAQLIMEKAEVDALKVFHKAYLDSEELMN